MNHLNDVIENFGLYHCIFRQGYVFTSVTEPANVFDGIVIRNPAKCDCWTPKLNVSEKSLEEHIALVNEYKLEKAVIIAEDINFITQCPSLKYIRITPADSAPENFDYSPLYKMPNLKYLVCRTSYGGIAEPYSTKVDYSNLNNLVEVDIQGKGHLNYKEIVSLESIQISEDKSLKDLQGFQCSKNLKKLWLMKTGLVSLDGIEEFVNLQSVSLDYMRSLQDISQLQNTADSLRSLWIENCPKITDFSCLEELVNLEHLALLGKNDLPDLKFLNAMKKLKTFTFSMNVMDCDLNPCLDIPFVSLEKNKKEYNLKDKDLPKQLPQDAFKLI